MTGVAASPCKIVVTGSNAYVTKINSGLNLEYYGLARRTKKFYTYQLVMSSPGRIVTAQAAVKDGSVHIMMNIGKRALIVWFKSKEPLEDTVVNIFCMHRMDQE